MSNVQWTDERRPVPIEVDRWNWGAFLLNWIWGIGNNTWIALLTLVPVVGFVMLFVLGFKGSAWAWRNGRWTDVAHFRRVQRNWAIAGVVVWLGVIALAFSIVGGLFYALKNSDVYSIAEKQVLASAEAQQALGTPITFGWPSGSVSLDGGGGLAALAFSASGPKASGQVAVAAVRENAAWRLEKLVLRLDEGGRTIDILKGTRAQRDIPRLALAHE